MNQLIICNIPVRQDQDGRYCLNDLHKASGAEKRHQPANWLRIEQTQELINELQNSSEVRSLITENPVVIIEGRKGGTFVAKELVYSFAMWISAKFHLHVIRAYDALVQMQHDLVKKATPKTKKMIEGCLTLEQQDAIKALVACRTEVLPKEKKGKAVITLWSSIKSKYGLAKDQTYKDIPAEQFEQVLSLVARVPLEGELLPKESLPSPSQEISAQDALDRLKKDAFLSSQELQDGIVILSEKLKTRAVTFAERAMMSEGMVKLA